MRQQHNLFPLLLCQHCGGKRKQITVWDGQQNPWKFQIAASGSFKVQIPQLPPEVNVRYMEDQMTSKLFAIKEIDFDPTPVINAINRTDVEERDQAIFHPDFEMCCANCESQEFRPKGHTPKFCAGETVLYCNEEFVIDAVAVRTWGRADLQLVYIMMPVDGDQRVRCEEDMLSPTGEEDGHPGKAEA